MLFMGFKKTSEVMAISFNLDESAANTFTTSQVDLTLSPLDQEVFIVVAVDLDPTAPNAIAGARTSSNANLTKSVQTAFINLGSSNTIAVSNRGIITTAAPADSPVGFEHTSLDSPVAQLDYVDIIATNNFHIGIVGDNNTAAMSVSGRMWGYRAKADAATYAALVQSEILSQ